MYSNQVTRNHVPYSSYGSTAQLGSSKKSSLSEKNTLYYFIAIAVLGLALGVIYTAVKKNKVKEKCVKGLSSEPCRNALVGTISDAAKNALPLAACANPASAHCVGAVLKAGKYITAKS